MSGGLTLVKGLQGTNLHALGQVRVHPCSRSVPTMSTDRPGVVPLWEAVAPDQAVWSQRVVLWSVLWSAADLWSSQMSNAMSCRYVVHFYFLFFQMSFLKVQQVLK